MNTSDDDTTPAHQGTRAAAPHPGLGDAVSHDLPRSVTTSPTPQRPASQEPIMSSTQQTQPSTDSTTATGATATTAGRRSSRTGRLGAVTALLGASVAVLGAAAVPADAATTTTPTVAITASATKAAAGAHVAVSAHSSAFLLGGSTFMRVTDVTTNTVLAQCNTGSYCTASVSSSVAATHTFSAHLDTGWGGPAPYPTLASATTSVAWVVPVVRFGTTATTVGAGGSVSVYAYTDVALDGSNYFLRLVDADSNALLRQCGTGTYCSYYTTNATAMTKAFSAHLDSGAQGPAPYPVVYAAPSRSVSWITSQSWSLGALNAGNVSMPGATLTVSQNGNWHLTGSLHDSSTWYGDQYSYGFAFNGLGHGAEVYGALGAEFSGPPVNADINISGNDPWITANWTKVAVATVHSDLTQSDDLWGALSELYGDLEPYAGTALTWLAAA